MPPVPLTVPRAIEPPLTVQLVQVLLRMVNRPVGALGPEQVPGRVVPTVVLPLRQPLVANTLANMVCTGPVWL